MSARCSLCLEPTHPPCGECHRPKDGPILARITIHKRAPALCRKENLDLCQTCERVIYRAIQECKERKT